MPNGIVRRATCLGTALGALAALILCLLRPDLAGVVLVAVGACYGSAVGAGVGSLCAGSPALAGSRSRAAATGLGGSVAITGWLLLIGRGGPFGLSGSLAVVLLAGVAGSIGGSLLEGRPLSVLAFRAAAALVLVGAAAGAVFGSVRGSTHLPTLPVAVIEGALLGAVAGALLAAPVALVAVLAAVVPRPHRSVTVRRSRP